MLIIMTLFAEVILSPVPNLFGHFLQYLVSCFAAKLLVYLFIFLCKSYITLVVYFKMHM